ncbi:S41 family peptidase [Pendulispora rubella]|uniref:S41 family peptidase n=1 Tax=Pendulispora rubella TaxID=2741070 RepID=A0ABZ2L2A8_9BACT
MVVACPVVVLRRAMGLFSLSAMALGCHPTEKAPSSSPPPQAPYGVYLSSSEAEGGELCFDPDSSRLRALLSAQRPNAEDSVDAQALARDLPFLEKTMRLQYAGYANLVQRGDFDLAQFFEEWRRDLSSAGAKVTVDRGLLAPLRKLRAVFPDNHHTVWGPSLREEPSFKVREYQAWVSSAEAVGPLASCRIQGPGAAFSHTLRLAPMVGPDGSRLVLTVSVRGGGERISAQCSGGAFELHPRPDVAKRIPPTQQEKLYTWRPVGDAAVITVRRLWGTGVQEQQLEELAKDYEAHRHFARIIFDFRGNGGGSDSPIYAWIAKAKNGLWDSGAERVLEGALTPCPTWNTVVQRQIQDRTVDTQEARDERAKVRAKWPHGLHRASWVYHSGVIDEHSDHPYSGRIYVLTDRHAGSSGESGPLALKLALGALLVGERTDGTLEFGNQSTFILPHSGVRWNLPIKQNLFEQPVESVGVPVDVYLADSAAPIERIVPMLMAERLPPAR